MKSLDGSGRVLPRDQHWWDSLEHRRWSANTPHEPQRDHQPQYHGVVASEAEAEHFLTLALHDHFIAAASCGKIWLMPSG